jgi:hypothetical protein
MSAPSRVIRLLLALDPSDSPGCALSFRFRRHDLYKYRISPEANAKVFRIAA